MDDSIEADNSLARVIAETTELAGGLAHELRNPLSTILINLKLLAEDLQDLDVDPEQTRRRTLLRVDTLQGEAERLQILCDDFLNLTGPCRVQREPTDLNALLARLVIFLEPLARQNDIRLEQRDPDAKIICQVDERRLSQAVLNLLINAQQAMPDGGLLRLSARRDGPGAIIEVSDSGAGITPEHREQVLRPFFSTKVGGTGLGLSITRRIVEAHDGALTFESTVGRGTTFTIRIPCDAGDSPDASGES
ncbi:MAG: two-component sensor histidine kinase [Planctomycetes bacterium]|nr:two-component sensor histidine kinase [Planctomycetota bacterium]